MLGKLNKFVVACFLAMLPIVSTADPVTGAIAAWYAGASAFAVALVAAQGFLVAYSIYGSSQQRKAAEDAQEQARQEYNTGLKDRTITRVATEAPYRYIYGQSRVGSDIVAVFTSGDKDQYKHLVCVHAAHECESIDEIFIAGEALGTLDANGDVTSGKFFVAHTDSIKEFPIGGNIGPGIVRANDVNLYRPQISSLTFATLQPVDSGTLQVTERVYNSSGDNATGMYDYIIIPSTVVGQTVTLSRLPANPANIIVHYLNSKGTSRVRVKKHLGSPTDPADASLIAELPDKWTSAATLRGFCYTVIRLDLNQAEFQGGIPTIEPLIKGKKLYDPRTGLTAWSSNPALAVYDYLTSEICGVPASDLPIAQYITAANVCDETITSYSYRMWIPAIGGTPSRTQVITGNYPKYTINGTVTSDQSQSKMLEAMAQCMAGSIVSTTWDISAGNYVAPVKALYQEDIIGNLAITPGISDADIYNGIKGQYIDPANKYVATDFTPYQNATYLATDGRDLFNNIDFQFTNELQRVHNLCRIFTEDQRNGFTIKAEFSQKAWGLKVGQRITFTSAFLGQTAKVYRITDKSYSPSSAVELTLKEDDPSIWDYADAIVADETPNTDLPDPFAITPLSSITCTSGTDALLLQGDGTVVSRILVEWPLATTQAVLTNGYIEVQWQGVTATDWQSTQTNGSDTQVFLSPVNDGMAYVVRARCVNPYFNVKSNWTYVTHTVVGKTEPPPDVTSVVYDSDTNTLSWSGVVAVDLDKYEVRYSIGAGTWDTATVLTSTLKSVTKVSPQLKSQYSVTFYVKSVDSSGNYSINSASVVASLVPPNISDLSISGTVLNWTNVVTSDLAGYVFKFNYGNNTDWGSAVPLHTGIITQSPFDLVTKPGGAVTIMGKAVDLVGNESTTSANITTNLGDPFVANVVETFTFSPTFSGTKVGCSLVGSNLVANNLDSFYGTDTQSFYGSSSASFYGTSSFDSMVYTTDAFTVTSSLANCKATLNKTIAGDGLVIEYRVQPTGGSYGPWVPWPGSIITAVNSSYQLRVTVGAGTVQGNISALSFVVDAPDIIETKQDVVISSTGTTIPYTSSFTAIKNIQATLQANASGAVTIEIDKTSPLAPKIKAYNSSHVAVSGATADITLKGY